MNVLIKFLEGLMDFIVLVLIKYKLYMNGSVIVVIGIEIK